MNETVRDLLIAAGQTALTYLFLIVLLRLLGRPIMAQFTQLEYLVIALLGSAVETGLYAGKTSLPPGLVSAFVLLAMNWLFALLLGRSAWLRRILVGTPLVLVHHGQFISAHLRHAGLTEENVRAAIRARGYERVDEVQLAVLEVNGAVGVIPMPTQNEAG